MWAFDGHCYTKMIILAQVLAKLIYIKPIFCHKFVENRLG